MRSISCAGHRDGTGKVRRGAERLIEQIRSGVPFSAVASQFSVLVFIPCLGAFVTPELLGGGKSLMIGNLIQNQFGASRNWPFGAALALTLLALVLITMTLYLMRFGRRPEVR